MALELKGFRHVAVAVPVLVIAGIVTVSPRQKSPESQQPDLVHNKHGLGRHRRWVVDGGTCFP